MRSSPSSRNLLSTADHLGTCCPSPRRCVSNATSRCCTRSSDLGSCNSYHAAFGEAVRLHTYGFSALSALPWIEAVGTVPGP
eukprot:2382461-Heterocapsa_arctica.AAC.1